MNGVSRFLSRRDKFHAKRASKQSASKVRIHLSPPPAPPTSPASLPAGLPSASSPAASLSSFDIEASSYSSDQIPPQQPQSIVSDLRAILSHEQPKPADKEDEKKIKALLQRLHADGITTLDEAQASYALAIHPNDPDQAYETLALAHASFEGILTDFDPNVKLLGAVNRNGVTCYLDALLFAMFARLDSFEAMLFDNFADEPRKRLAATLRLWVNFLRTGRLISVELMKHLQDALASCGWEEAAEVCQQDASEAFTFITGALELPLLTLKMDIYHTGREDKEDDHKFVNERLLEVAIPEHDDEKVATLEDCLEAYFNNRIEVKRYLQRQNTNRSSRSIDRDPEKNEAVHIESIEIPETSSPTSPYPTPTSPTRPFEGRLRGDSIFTDRHRIEKRVSDEQKAFDEKRHLDEMWKTTSSEGRPRSSSLRKEVLMPAWQFFSLIPWYTDNVPQSDAQVAAHFSAKRPVLGICLKRYQVLSDGSSKRLNTFIDIPLEIGLPHFVSDDRREDAGPLFGNFKLVLQSVVCHRGIRVDSGHYVSLVRANKSPRSETPRSSKEDSDEIADSWLRFDDLSRERVVEVDIKQALKEESPYLLFFQVQPIDEELASRGDPPSYSELQSVMNLTSDPSRETLASSKDAASAEPDMGEWEKIANPDSGPASDEPANRSSMSSFRRSSVTFDIEGSIESLNRGRTAPPTPAEDNKLGFLGTSRRNSKALAPGGANSKSRPSSQNGETRLSFTLSRLTGRTSKDKLKSAEAGNSSAVADDSAIATHSVKSSDSGETGEADGAGASLKEKEKEKQSGGHLGRSKSRRDKGKGKEKEKSDKEKHKKGRSKSGDPALHKKDPAHHKNRPDRECVVM